MATAVSSLTELAHFVLSRVDEEESELRAAHRRIARGEGTAADWAVEPIIERRLAECDSKRCVLGNAQQLLVLHDAPAERSVRVRAAHILRALAAPYSGHHGYRSDWAPQR